MTAPPPEMPAPEMGTPHVVILGAGASRAACPSGDRNGRTLPLMTDLVQTVGLAPLLDKAGVSTDPDDFEATYSRLVTEGQHPDLAHEMERLIWSYFAGLRLPGEPSLYDHLVLSLRPKDLIATFNWDPLLWQALHRNAPHAPLPKAVFLHGNVPVGYCFDHDPPTLGALGQSCGSCGRDLVAGPLLYPVAEKDYSEAAPIRRAWECLREHVQIAFLFTIFGYGAPDTDQAARQLLIDSWGNPSERDFEEVEIINLLDHDTLYRQWSRIILRDHYRTLTDFYNSLAALHPRRSCESWWNAVARNAPDVERPIPRDAGWRKLWDWFAPLVDEE